MFSITRVTTLPLETAKNIIFNRSRAGRLFVMELHLRTGSRLIIFLLGTNLAGDSGLVFKDQITAGLTHKIKWMVLVLRQVRVINVPFIIEMHSVDKRSANS